MASSANSASKGGRSSLCRKAGDMAKRHQRTEKALGHRKRQPWRSEKRKPANMLTSAKANNGQAKKGHQCSLSTDGISKAAAKWHRNGESSINSGKLASA